MGNVKDVSSISNLRTLIMKEGFSVVNLVYLGGLWVMIECDNVETKANMLQHTGVKSWFHVLQNVVHDFALDIEDNVDSSFGRKRLCIKTKLPLSTLESFKVIFKGKVYMVRAKELFTWSPIFLGQKEMEYTSDEDSDVRPQKVPDRSQFCEERPNDDRVSDVEKVSETDFGDNSSIPINHIDELEKQQSEDPFNIYMLLRKQPGDESPEVQADFDLIPFRFYHSWISFEGFDAMVEQTWRLLDGGDVFDSNLLRRSELHRNLYNINQMESKEYLQKSKIKWAIEGDENSKFFHGLINKKRSQLAIRGVFVDGIWCTNPNKVKEAFFKHFEARFKKPVNHRLKINFLFSKRLSDVQASDLERRVSRDEIRLAVWNYGENKSPCPDGYSFEFFRKYWNLVGSDLCDIVEYFFDTGSFPNGCNSSFVALISKITEAKFVNDFRPISLIGSVYKVVTKVLANRLALVISDLISDTQSAFVANRQILDGPFILNELLHWCKRKKKQVMFFKVDFAKAYDSLEAFGFDNIWDTCFWNDKWLGDKPLKDLFSRLFALELNKEVTVADKVQGVVSSSFRRPVRTGSEYQHLTDLNSLMEPVSLSHSCDRWICDLSGDREFRVKEFRDFLDNLFLPSYADVTRWVKYIPIKINIFVWHARRDFLPTRVNLSRRESIFRRICQWWELDWQALESFSDWNSWFSLIRLSSKVKALLEGVFGVAWWSIWGFRNHTIYNEMPPRRSVLFDDIMVMSQSKFAKEVLERARMQTCNSCRTPVGIDSKLGSDSEPISDPTLYRNLWGMKLELVYWAKDMVQT
nr:RNA-directed DNA polymerase, eukaryota [Tanacetum cinerariifolium]